MFRTNDESDRTLWMGDLDEKWDANAITEAFARMGEQAVNVKLVVDRQSGKQAGYCFVEFADRESARRAMLHINGKPIPKSRRSTTFNLSFANSPNSPYTEYNLFVNNLPSCVDDAALFLIFGERYESCRGAKVYRNIDGSSKGLGFVRFSDQTDQQRALLEMNKYRVAGRPIYLKLAQPKVRAPRLGKNQNSSNVDNSFGYYNQAQQNPRDINQSYYNLSLAPIPSTFPASYTCSGTSCTRTQAQPSSFALSTVGNVSAYEDTDVPISSTKVEESNAAFMKSSEELYEALEESRWGQIIFDSSLTVDKFLCSYC